MRKCLFLRPQMEFSGPVKAKNHQKRMGLSQVNRPMDLGKDFNLPLNFKGALGGQKRLKK